MQIVIEHHGAQRELDLVVEDPSACVADLVGAANGAAPVVDGDRAGVVVEGRFFGPEIGLDEIGLHEGAVVRIARDAPAPPEATDGPALAVVAGPVAGTIFPLEPGTLVVGRDAACDISIADPTLSARHVRLRIDDDGAVAVTDLASHNGTWIEGEPVVGNDERDLEPGALLRLGTLHARVLPSLPDDRPIAADPLHRAVGGVVPFNRPPRAAMPEEPSPIEAPEPPGKSGRGPAFSIITIIAPLAMGAVLIAIYKDPRFAAFMLLSPVIAIGNAISAKRRARKEKRGANKEYREGLANLERELTEAAAAETERREVLLPDPAETLRRATGPSTQLWQRRLTHPDFLRLRAGIGTVPWQPPVTVARKKSGAEVTELLERYHSLARAAAEVDLSSGGVVGLIGNRTSALALARSLVCQAAVHHGPADLGVVVAASAEHCDDWDWAKWLPHTLDATGSARLLAGDRATSDALLGAIVDAAEEERARTPGLRADDNTVGRTRLLVLDEVSLIEGRRAPARLILQGVAGPVAGIVIAPTEDQLPAVCNTVVELRSDLGDATLYRPQERSLRVDDLVIGGIDEDAARRVARALARYEDSELELAGAGLPALVRLLPLLGLEDVDGGAIDGRWQHGIVDPPPRAPIGLGDDGVLQLDLVRDGPHGLIGGTTGAGKSELLRSMVAGMASLDDPEQLVFVLVDYKGGSAFDACGRLPHTVGIVTDLDEYLGERALRSLDAEISHRERLLRDAAAQDLPEYRRLGSPRGPLPRLVVVIDEFATLANELPDFLGALVAIAQRGRSLGVHLILATQRPQGAVNANIKANTNLRIALRVQDPGDSIDIIDRRDASSIARSTPGRAYVRLGPGEVALIQTALSTTVASERSTGGIRLAPFRFGPVAATRGDGAGTPTGTTDLARLVAAIGDAWKGRSQGPPRRPWLEMLPDHIELPAILERSDGLDRSDGDVAVPFALADDPDHQRQAAVGWDPADGHLALFGMVGSGTTTALLAVGRALVERQTPDRCVIYGIDFGAGGLSALAPLPHVGAVVSAADRELQFRLVRSLRRELDRRRALDPAERAAEPRIVVLLDGIGAFLAEHDNIESAELTDAFRRVFAEGPEVGVSLVVTAERPGALPMRMSSLVSQKVLFRLADPNEFSLIGMRARQLPAFVPGRVVHGESGLVAQVGLPGAVGTWRVAGGAPDQAEDRSRALRALRSLPTRLEYAELPTPGAHLEPPVELTLGVRDDDLEPAVLTLHPGDHALVAGPPRSGKTSALALCAALIRAADPKTVLVAVCEERSPLFSLEALDGAGTAEDLADVLRVAPTDERRWFVLVDDAPRVDDASGALAALAESRRPGLHVLAAGRSDELRGGFGHWTRALRQSRTGLLLQPDLTADGDLLGVRLPRRLHTPLVPGRGFVVVAADATLAQVALPPGA